MGAKEDHESLLAMVERMKGNEKLNDEEADNFIREGMTRLGHKMSIIWEDSEPEGKTKEPKSNSLFSVPSGKASGQYPNG